MALRMGGGPLRPTVRGVAVCAAAALFVLGGLVLGRREAVAIGLFLTVLPVASVVMLAVQVRVAGRTRLERSIIPPELMAGDTAQVTFTGVVPGLRDAVPGRAPVPVPAGGYAWPAPRRGVYDVGPARAQLTSAFGLWTGTATVAGTSRVPVVPAPVDETVLDEILRGGTGELDAADLLGSEAAADDLLVREHRDGDALARVHWGATARTGRLMVRQEEWAQEKWTVVVLDCRAVSFTADRYEVDGGAGRRWQTSPVFERAVSLAAALIDRLESAGHHVLVVDQDGRRLDPALAEVVLEPALREAAWPDTVPARAASVLVLLGTAVGQDVPVMATVPRTLHRVALLFGTAATSSPGPSGGPGPMASPARSGQPVQRGQSAQPGPPVPQGQTGPAAALEQGGWLVTEVRS